MSSMSLDFRASTLVAAPFPYKLALHGLQIREKLGRVLINLVHDAPSKWFIGAS